nr:MAG TPA: hypothetical protein [Caudoviricetes sp.]
MRCINDFLILVILKLVFSLSASTQLAVSCGTDYLRC